MVNYIGAKISFASRPTTTAADRRSWLVRYPGTGYPTEIVRVYPSATTQFVCTCKHSGRGDCPHIAVVREADAAKFAKEGTK